MPDEKPPEKVTTQIPKVEIMEGLLKQLTTSMQEQFGKVHSDNAVLRADVGLVANDLSLVKERVTLLERDRDDERARVARHSSRVKELAETTSSADLSHDAQIAAEIVARKKLEDDVEEIRKSTQWIFTVASKLHALVFENKRNKVIIGLVLIALTKAVEKWLTAKGLL